MRRLALVAILGATVLSGCAGAQSAESRAVRAALDSSPLSYSYFRSETWWGRKVDIDVPVIHADGNWAVAELSAGGTHDTERQWVLLRRKATHWHAVAAAGKRATDLACKLAPPGVVRRLVGGCSRRPLWGSVTVRGPLDARPASAAEARAIAASYIRTFGGGKKPCGGVQLSISRLDAAYVRVVWPSVHDRSRQGTDCSANQAVVVLYHHTPRLEASTVGTAGHFFCAEGPPGVVRSLFGSCWTGVSPFR